MWFANRFDTNQAVHAQKMDRDRIFFDLEGREELCYPCSKNTGADQLPGEREADLCLCFCICKTLFFS